MAKLKGKQSSVAGDSAPSEKENLNVKNTVDDGASFADLSGAALANLTKNIQQRLKGNAKPESTPQNNKKKPAPKAPEARKETKPVVSDNAPNKTGKKRDRSGKIITPQPKKATSTVSSSVPKNTPKGNALEQEIFAIGGTKEDLELLAGIDSDSEMEDITEVKGRGDNVDQLRSHLGKLMGGGGDKTTGPVKDSPAPSKIEKSKAERPKAEKPKAEKPKIEKPQREEKPNEKASKKNEKKNEKRKVAEEAKPAVQMQTVQNNKNAQTSKKSSSKFTIPPRPDWFATPLTKIGVDTKAPANIPRRALESLHEYALSLLDAENKLYTSNQESSSSTYKFYSTIVSSGTLSDKISALTLAAQESPLHNVKALETLVGLAGKRSRSQAVEVLRSLKDLFAQGTLLPSDRRLKSFVNQPELSTAIIASGGNWAQGAPLPAGLEPNHLIIWAFEDFLKEQYFEVLKIIEVWCNDEIEFSRSRAVSYIYELLKEKPEQESNLLRLLVNKLGDPAKKIASRASYLLLQLQQTHPLMKATIISSIEAELLFRPGQSQHAKYYAVITLNQTILTNGDTKPAEQLLNIYFGLFVSLLKRKEPPTNNKDNKDKKDKHGKPIKPTKPKGKKAREIAKGQSQDEELGEKLISAVLTGVNRAYPFIASSYEQLSKHLDTLFRITNSSNFNTSIQSLMLIQQLSTSHSVSSDRFYRTLYESLLDPRIATSSKQSMYLNLLYKALKADLNVKRVKAFVKRLIQVLGLHQPSFICGVLYLIRELESTFPSLTTLVDQPEVDDSDDEEVFRDVPEEGEEAVVVQIEKEKQPTVTNKYDSRKRDPEQSNADRSCLWELLPYLSHFHPSVSVSARQLLAHEKMSGKPDLTIHTLTHFLDRFVYRSPKASSALRGSSIMQPLAAGDTSGLLVSAGKMARTQDPVNSEAFWKKRAEDVAADDVFFHDYFNRLGKDKERMQKTKKKSGKKDDDSEDESDAESEIWKALVDSAPDIDGGLSDDDLDLDDLESAMDDEEGEGESDQDGGAEGRDIDDVMFSDEDEEEEEEESDDQGKPSTEAMQEPDFEPFEMDISDEDAFRDSDEDLPSDLDIDMEAPEKEESEQLSKREKRRKLKNLPIFASMDDYAALLDQDDLDEAF